jgi:hypothetical protein
MAIGKARDLGINSTQKPKSFNRLNNNADFSNSATGTYTDGGISYKYVKFTANGTLTIVRAGFADVLIVGGGGGSGGSTPWGGGGGIIDGSHFLEIGSYSVVIGSGAAASNGAAGTASSLGTSRALFSGVSTGGSACSRSTSRPGSLSLTYSNTITGTELNYGIARDSFSSANGQSVPRTNFGDGGGQGATSSGSGTSGVVIVRVEI